MWEGQTFSAAEENIDVDMYTLSMRKGKQLQKKIF
jgi:hypothetical protein